MGCFGRAAAGRLVGDRGDAARRQTRLFVNMSNLQWYIAVLCHKCTVYCNISLLRLLFTRCRLL